MQEVNFKIDGKYAKLLKAYAELFNLQHSVKCGQRPYMNSTELEVSLYVKTPWYESVIDVFAIGRRAYVSSMRKYICYATEDDVERLSKEIIEGTFGENYYIKSMKGGDCLTIYGEPIPRFELHDLPKSEDDLLVRLDLAGIDVDSQSIEIGKL